MQMDRSREVSNIGAPSLQLHLAVTCLMDYRVVCELLTWIQKPVRCGSARLQEKSETWMSLRARRELFSEGDKRWTCYGVASDQHWAFNPFIAPSTPTPCHSLPWIMEILWKTLTWTLSLVVMAASEFQSVNRRSYNSQGMMGTDGQKALKAFTVTKNLFIILRFLFFSFL